MSASHDVLLGIDVGTSSVKVVAITTSGTVLGDHSVAYETTTPRPGWAEQDAAAWWRAIGEATRALLARVEERGPSTVVGIGLSGQMHTFVLLDDDDRPLRPAITWMDTRGEGLLEDARRRVAEADLAQQLANPVVLGLTLLPLTWLAAHEPNVLARAATLLLAKDYVRMRLTGEKGSEPTDASATLLFDVAARAWSDATVAAFGLPRGMLPTLGESATVAGTLRDEAAEHLGLRPGIPVAFGAGDQQAAAVGMGSVRAGQVQLTVGTGAQVLAVRDRVVADVSGRLHAFCHVRGWITQASVNNAGSALAWVCNLLGVGWNDVYAGLGRGVGGPVFVPYLTGERTPLMKGHARGAWIGLSSEHTSSDLARAAGEGVVAAIAEAIGTVVETRTWRGALRVAGGGMGHATFAQALADASGLPIEVRETHEASGVGAALLAGVAVGAFGGLDEAAALAPERIAAEYQPDPAQHEGWAARRATLRELDAIGFHEVVERTRSDRRVRTIR